VYVLFFASAGADLDLPLLGQLWPVALALALSRGAVTFGASRVSSALSRDAPLMQKWSWAPLIAQAGLTQGLAGVVERQFPSFGAPFRALTIAVLAINAIVGPVLFKMALDRTKETRAPSPSFEEQGESAEVVA
jgi:Kef-type K+ transport system membrane component KefB